MEHSVQCSVLQKCPQVIIGPPSARPGRLGHAASWIIAALIGLAAAPVLSAEPVPVDPDLATEGMRRVGPFFLKPAFVVKDVGYDDNILLETPEPIGDQTATFGARLDALMHGGDHFALRLSGELDQVLYEEYDVLNHRDGFARARGIVPLKRGVVSIEEFYRSYQDRSLSEIDERVRTESNLITAGARLQLHSRHSLYLFSRREDLQYTVEVGDDASIPQRLNRQENSFGLRGEMRVRPRTTAILEAMVEDIVFDDPSEGRDSKARSILPGFRLDSRAAVRGEIKIGVIDLRAPSRPESDYRGTIGNGWLAWRLASALRMRTTFARDLQFSTTDGNLYYVSTSWTLAFEQFLSRRLSTELLYGQGLNHYPVPLTSGGSGAGGVVRDDTLLRYEVGIRYRTQGQGRLEARVGRQVRDSNLDSQDRERNVYTIGTTYEF